MSSLVPGEGIRAQFPILQRVTSSGKPLCYLDSAATALKPQPVIDAVSKVLGHYTSNVNRGVHFLGDEVTTIYEGARRKVARFINAEDHEIVLLRNATEALNLVARCWPIKGRLLIPYSEHHSNYLPWAGEVTYLRPLQDGSLDMDLLTRELARGDVALVTVSQISNVSGVLTDVAEVTRLCHSHGAHVMVDAAQSAGHESIDVRAIDCDFLAFSGHKLGAPTGTGVLFAKAEHMLEFEWYLRGGSTVDEVHLDREVPKAPPWKFEAGTPLIESAAGLGKAIEFLTSVGMDKISAHQQNLTSYALDKLSSALPEVVFLGPTDDTRRGPVSMMFPGISPHTLARGLSDAYGICARSGFHCAQPLHQVLNKGATLRLSFYLYNTRSEIEYACEALNELLALRRS